MDKTKFVRVIPVIEITTVRGSGSPEDPVRRVTEYWTTDGQKLTDRDQAVSENELSEPPEIGSRIQTLRKQAGLTQVELAARSGISRSHIVEIEANRYSPTLKTLEAIANACGKQVKDLL